MAALLEVEALVASVPGPKGLVRVVDQVSFSLEAGRCLGLVGESGCGKTMTALSLMRLLPAGATCEGSVRLEGQSLLELREPQMQAVRGRRLAMVFQEPLSALNPLLRVGDQIAETVATHTPARGEAARRRAVELLAAMGLSDPEARAAAYPHQLSGGMRQRALIAAALACDPKVLIADEPTTALDVTVQAQLLALLSRLKAERRLGLLLVTHDLGVVAELCDEVAVMYAGQIVERASVDELFAAPAHPYTRALIRSRPVRGTPLAALSGAVPLPGAWPPGCRFRQRCDRAVARCGLEVPPLEARGPHQAAACFHPLPREPGR